ncbi:glutamate-rich protein 1 isoform X2 [Syngnathus acus]|uniref:glutamate-rich protein 1 isoform X2 n=1 Tax=Syngnathus acus TaxID=161584 RepID=UPI0018862C0C|nr:glutamate-rich protein 1 isoform X2 [Syngnathus acus]
MTHRKEVFQSKVLQKLYPSAPKLEKEPSPSCIPVDVKRTSNRDITPSNSAVVPSRRIYTVLPPPEDYDATSVKCVTLQQLETINSEEVPSEQDIQECSEELDQDEEANELKRRRKRRKRRLNLHGDKDGTAPTMVTSVVQNGTLIDEEGVHISRNKKRKLKKKRHKEKMLSMGLMPRASALEFTFQTKNEEEEDGMRAAEVVDFLRTTLEIYKSDSLLRAEKLPRMPGVLEDLLSSIVNGSRPVSLLKHLHNLKLCTQHKDTKRLEKELQDLSNNTLIPPEETSAVAQLFQYWITDILPMKGVNETKVSERFSHAATPCKEEIC